jgi:phosphate uptake regulator
MTKPKPGRPSAHAPAPRAGPRLARTNPAAPLERPPAPAPPGPVRSAAVVEVDPAEPAEHLFRRLLSSYLGGVAAVEVVEVPRLSSSTREVVRAFCRRTRGPEVVADDGRTLTVADLEPAGTGSLDARLAELGHRVLAFHREAVESWSRLPLGADARWSERDDEIDRDAWYLERCLARAEGGSRRSSPPVTTAWTIARSLERIGDHAVTLGEVGPRLAEFGPSATPVRELRQFHAQAMAHLAAVLDARDAAGANELLDVGEALVASGRVLTERLLPAVGDGVMAPATAAAVARALEAVSRTVAYSQDIAQAFFDRTLRGPASSPRGRPQLAVGR